MMITLESILRDLITDSKGKKGKELTELIKSYAQDLRKYALESFSSLGGQATARKYGKEHFRQAGKKGMLKRWSRIGRCPFCNVGTGSRHKKDCQRDSKGYGFVTSSTVKI